MTEEDVAVLQRAVQSLENPGLAARLTNTLGKPIELIGSALPASVSQEITTAASKAIDMALQVALLTMQRKPRAASELLHKALATASGAAGGAFGIATLPIELPVSTIIMLRSIADIARSEGENLSDAETALSCVQVFALGGRAGSTDASESGYFAVRAILAKSVTEATRFIAERGDFFNSIGQNPRLPHRNINGCFSSLSRHPRGRRSRQNCCDWTQPFLRRVRLEPQIGGIERRCCVARFPEAPN
jgi:EcsC protein family